MHTVSFLDPFLLISDVLLVTEVITLPENDVLRRGNSLLISFADGKMLLHEIGQGGRACIVFPKPELVSRAWFGNSVAGDDRSSAGESNSVPRVDIPSAPFTPSMPAGLPEPTLFTVLTHIIKSDGEDLGSIWPLIGPSTLWCKISLTTACLDRLFLGQQQPPFTLSVPITEHPRASTRLDDKVNAWLNRNLQRCCTKSGSFRILPKQVLYWGFDPCQSG